MRYIKPEQCPQIQTGQYRMEGTTAVLIDGSGQVLLHHRDDIPTIRYPDHWSLPGGAKEPGETAIETIRRELREELALEYQREELKLLGQILDRHNVLLTVFMARIDRSADDLQVHEGRGIAFFRPEELPEKTTPHARDIIRDCFSQQGA